MKQIIEGKGRIKFQYNYITENGIKFKCGETYQYECIVSKSTESCNCAGKVNTYYKIANSYIPTTRAIKID